MDLRLLLRRIFSLEVAAVWFVFIALVNLSLEDKINFILPYAWPVVGVVWFNGLRHGFLVSAFGTLSAAAGGVIPTHPGIISLTEEGLLAYAKLSSVAIGIAAGKYLALRRIQQNRDQRL